MSRNIHFVLNAYFGTVFIFQYGVLSFISDEEGVKCYQDLSCFSAGPPFKSPSRPISKLPESPDTIKTMFILYTRENHKQGQTLDARNAKDVKHTWTNFKIRKTQFIVHGYHDDYNNARWITAIKDELLEHGDYNTVIVDWHHGNQHPYSQATANTRVVGAQIALLIKQLRADFGVDPGDIHIIGHSLGAHVAGYAGEGIQHTERLGRITGLDPASPYFAGTDKVVRLDWTDAMLVDTIHSDAETDLNFGFGIRSAIGHMDFYPNLGHDQPGCNKTLWSFIQVVHEDKMIDSSIFCSHMRSVKFFLESINSNCPFTAFPCDSEDDFKAYKCHSCDKDTCASMGFKADRSKPSGGKRVKYYTTTTKDSPFCQYHLQANLKLSKASPRKNEKGTLKIRLHGNETYSDWIPLDTTPVFYNQNKTYAREVLLSYDLGELRYVELQWKPVSSILNPLEWNVLDVREHTVYFDEVDIIQQDLRKETDFCADKTAVKNHTLFSMYNPCK